MLKIGLSILVTISLVSGCAVSPKELSTKSMAEINDTDRQGFMKEVPEITGPLSLEEAIARALKYNLDQRVKMLEQSLAAGELEAGRFDMLPKLLADAGYDWRDNFSHRWEGEYVDKSTIPAPIKGDPPNVSVDPRHGTADLRLTWNILDFGASYYTARQNSDKLLIAAEKRRKAMHSLVRNVRTAYWRAVAAESLTSRVRQTIEASEDALGQSQMLSRERVSAPDESLRYQRNLLENLRLLESVERELASARIELASLMGVLPGTRFELVVPETELEPITVPMAELEAVALLQNAELRQQFLNVRIAVDETRKSIVKLLPGVNLDFGTYYDSDRYLVNENWRAAGISVSYNLFNLLSGPSRIEASERNESLAVAQRMAMQMSVVTRVHLAKHQYTDALRQYTRANQIYQVDNQLEQIVSGKYASNMVSEQTRISASVTTILSELRRYQAMSKFQEAVGQLQSDLGLEPALGSLDDLSLEELSESIRGWISTGINSSANTMIGGGING
ncbi:MAG TPA: TolC family protein [Marinobacterium sp.]|nr:TolC family protein [Marinobacterium sp.]